MNITFDKATNIFQLNTKTTSYLIGIADGKYIGHIYYGKKLDNCQGTYELLRTAERPFVPSQNERDKAAFADAFPPMDIRVTLLYRENLPLAGFPLTALYQARCSNHPGFIAKGSNLNLRQFPFFTAKTPFTHHFP